MEANRIHYYRNRANMSRNMLATKAGITAANMHDIENGKLGISPSMRKVLSQLLGVDEPELFPQKAFDLVLS